ncbi:uncharacterized protein LOC124147996 isoform X3 [Haliotis rufescens]|uniref:uncharacterized protein LOC124147996 isoform X2 n=1 Tax=Haliotis rufescens TaxID=6454 RepID=UPI00201F196D|nr:uncharacterized protein LOC124147996 isoform X2 [Haliotis rufescens]XP_048254340.1 uncharacterized protein LOC124147996 isoform X3 [Haliotis rufescens]
MMCTFCIGCKMDLKCLLLTTLTQLISCQDRILKITPTRTTVGSPVELVCGQPTQAWRSVWNRDGQHVLTVEKTRENPCVVTWSIARPTNTTVTCQENSGRFLLKFQQTMIELNGTIWDCEIDGSVVSKSITIDLTEKTNAQPNVNVHMKNNALRYGDNMSIVCKVSGEANVTDITWNQHWKAKFIRKVKGPFSALHQYNVTGVTYEDEGNYTCNVTAVVPREGKVFLSGSIEILIHGQPVFKSQGQRLKTVSPGQDVTLTFQYLASSIVENHTIFHNNFPQNIPSCNNSVDLTLLMHNVTLMREGFMVNITLNNVTHLERGNYSVKACNDLGCTTSYSIQLQVVSDPTISSTFNFLIPVSVSVGCVLLAGAMAGLIITLRKRSRRRSCVNGTATPNDRKPRGKASSLVMQENELYEKSEELQTVQKMDTDDVYTEVKKT